MKRIQLFATSWSERNTSINFPQASHDVTSSISVKWPSTWIGEFMILLGRNLKDVMRDKGSLGATLGQGIFIMLIMGFIYFGVTMDEAGLLCMS